MGLFDQSAKFATKAEPAFVLARLRPEIGLTLTFRRWFEDKVPLPGGAEREADLVAVADEAAERIEGSEIDDETRPPWLLIFEIQSAHDEGKAKVLHLEAAAFHCYAKDVDKEGGPFLPLPVFVYLKGKCPGVTVVVRTPTGRGFGCDPAVWEVGEDSAAEALAKVKPGEYSWGAMFWISLMAGAEKDEVIDEWRRLLDDKVPEKSRPDVAYVASQFAELVARKIAWDRVKQGVKMTESAIANEMIELGEMRMARENLTEFIKARFPEVLTPEVEHAIADQPDLGLMRTWIRAAGAAKTAGEFMAVLRR